MRTRSSSNTVSPKTSGTSFFFQFVFDFVVGRLRNSYLLGLCGIRLSDLISRLIDFVWWVSFQLNYDPVFVCPVNIIRFLFWAIVVALQNCWKFSPTYRFPFSAQNHALGLFWVGING